MCTPITIHHACTRLLDCYSNRKAKASELQLGQANVRLHRIVEHLKCHLNIRLHVIICSGECQLPVEEGGRAGLERTSARFF